MGRCLHKIMSLEKIVAVESKELVSILKEIKEVEKLANEYFDTIKEFIAKSNTPGHVSSIDDIRKKAEINYKDSLFQADRQELINKMKPIIDKLFDGKLEEYEELASVEPKEESETEVNVKIINVLEEFKKAYAEKNNKPAQVAEEIVA